MAFPPSFLEELRARLTLSSVVGRRVKLVKAGREYKACCPFHNEKSPSFYVNDDKSFFNCFGCGTHGDVITFVMRIDHLAFPEAVEKLAGEAGLDVPRLTPQERQQAERAKTLGDAVEAACAWFQEQLYAPVGKAALAYLRGRGLGEETIKRFRLGFAPNGRAILQDAMKEKGFDRKLLLEAALIGDPQDGREPFDFFRNRVIFPITDRRGRVIAFGGRVMDDSKPKYLNSRDTPLFHKRANLFALDKARIAIGERKAQALIVEGYMDVIALHQAGFGGAVAPLGTALTEEQILALWRVHPEPVVCLDGDAAGQRAASKTAEIVLPILKPGFTLKFATLPAGEDPDSLVASGGGGAMESVVKSAADLASTLWAGATSGRSLRNADEKAALEGEIREKLAKIVDPIVRRSYESELIFSRLRAAGFAKREFSVYRGAGYRGTGDKNKKPQKDTGLRATLADFEQWKKRGPEVLLMATLNFPELVLDSAEALSDFDLADPPLRRLRSHIFDWLHESISLDQKIDRDSLRAYLSQIGLARQVDKLVEPESFQYGTYFHATWARPNSVKEGVMAGFSHTIDFLKKAKLKSEIRDAEQRLAEDASEDNVAVVKSLANDYANYDGNDVLTDEDSRISSA